MKPPRRAAAATSPKVEKPTTPPVAPAAAARKSSQSASANPAVRSVRSVPAKAKAAISEPKLTPDSFGKPAVKAPKKAGRTEVPHQQAPLPPAPVKASTLEAKPSRPAPRGATPPASAKSKTVPAKSKRAPAAGRVPAPIPGSPAKPSQSTKPARAVAAVQPSPGTTEASVPAVPAGRAEKKDIEVTRPEPLNTKRIPVQPTVGKVAVPALPESLSSPEFPPSFRSHERLSRTGQVTRRLPAMPSALFESDPVPMASLPSNDPGPSELASPALEMFELPSGRELGVPTCWPESESLVAASPWAPLTPNLESPVPVTCEASLPAPSPAPIAERVESPVAVRLWMVARDSFTLIAYWTPRVAELASLSAAWGPGVWQLRLWLEAAGPAAGPEVLLDLTTHPESTHHFVPVLHAGQRYFAELGHLTPEGLWRSVGRSDAIATPPDHGTVPAPIPRFGAANFAAVPAPGARRSAGPPAAVARRLPAAQPRTAPPSGTDVWEQVVVERRIRMVEEEFLRQSPGSSGEVVKAREISQETVVMARLPGLPVNPAGEAAPGSAMPSSEASLPPWSPRGFWFEVNAELIVHGRTERGATVTLGGRPVRLRADGSFTFRFALPDGDYSLPAVAVSAARDDQRSAALRFVRETRYDGAVGVHPIAPELQPPTPAAVVDPLL